MIIDQRSLTGTWENTLGFGLFGQDAQYDV